jgi:hypothetical protein
MKKYITVTIHRGIFGKKLKKFRVELENKNKKEIKK